MCCQDDFKARRPKSISIALVMVDLLGERPSYSCDSAIWLRDLGPTLAVRIEPRSSLLLCLVH